MYKYLRRLFLTSHPMGPGFRMGTHLEWESGKCSQLLQYRTLPSHIFHYPLYSYFIPTARLNYTVPWNDIFLLWKLKCIPFKGILQNSSLRWNYCVWLYKKPLKSLVSLSVLFFHLFSALSCRSGNLGKGYGIWQCGVPHFSFGFHYSCPWLLVLLQMEYLFNWYGTKTEEKGDLHHSGFILRQQSQHSPQTAIYSISIFYVIDFSPYVLLPISFSQIHPCKSVMNLRYCHSVWDSYYPALVTLKSSL